MTQTIVLIGFRGTGKTTLAQRAAHELGCSCLSTDALVEQAVGMSISNYVRQRGWEAFRQCECDVIHALNPEQPCILDCGGGVVENRHVMEKLQHIGTIAWVDANLADIGQRLANDTTRPLLSRGDIQRDIEENYARRKPLYEQYAQVYINTSALALTACVEQLVGTAQQQQRTT